MEEISPGSQGLLLDECGEKGENAPENTEEGISLAAWKRVFHYVHSMVGSRSEAEDITQEAFIQLFRETEGGRPVEYVSAWMRTVTRRLVYRRFHKMRPDLHISLDERNAQGNRLVLDPIDPAPSAEEAVIDRNLLLLGAKVLNRFSQKDRECILMYFRGYDFSQIATLLGVSRWTARRTTLRALKKLQARIDRPRT